MPGILFVLLIGYVAAQSYDAYYQQQLQQQQQHQQQSQEQQRCQSKQQQQQQQQQQQLTLQQQYAANVQSPIQFPTSTEELQLQSIDISTTSAPSQRASKHHTGFHKVLPLPTATELPLASYNIAAAPPIAVVFNVPPPALLQHSQPLPQARPILTRWPPAPMHQTGQVQEKLSWDTSPNNGNINRFNSAVASAAVTTSDLPSTNSHNKFSADLFQVIAGSLPQRNIVYSPISVQMLLAFVYTGATGQTAVQLQHALSLPAAKLDTATLFYNLLQTLRQGGDSRLMMANKMYHSDRLTVQPEMAQRVRDYFDNAIEPIDFGAPFAAAATINTWVAGKTQNRIPQLVTPNELDAQTQAILVSAIHFKAKWEKEFSTTNTAPQYFYVSPQRTVPVNMMYNDDTYRYGAFAELDAAALEMPYDNSNLSMLILLPNQLDGLPLLEQRLQGIDLNTLTARMQPETVTVRLPRFRVEFQLDMQEALRKLGITDLFTDKAELKGFFNSQPVSVSKVQHKAFLDVNEAGSEAAAASFIKLIPLSLPNRIFYFTADHPFIFAIRSSQAVFFIGHVVNIP